ncbi:F-box domain-containing protein [Mycena kentingensis (nom. inval.)]|nr:F-box domain-containing protein [Mycena kentingensis (nom. inval.)]
MDEYSPADRNRDRTRLATLDSLLADLRAERQQIRDRLDAIVYPVLTIPNEIISEIFLQYIPTGIYPGRCLLRGDHSSPMTLAQVCRRWRAISHGTPTLWRALDLQDFNIPRRAASVGAQLSATRSWLQRAAALPLSLAFLASQPQLLQILEPHSARWEHILISKFSAWLLLPTQLPSLRSLNLNIYHDRLKNQDSERWLGRPRIVAQHLCVAFLRDVFDSSILGYLPWAQLQYLYLHTVTIPIAATVLREAGRLHQCRLGLQEGRDEAVPVAPISLPHLDLLVVEFGDPDSDLHEFLRSLRLPNLKRLYIHGDISERLEDHVPGLTAIVGNMGCRLEQLCIVTVSTAVEDKYRAEFAHIPLLQLRNDYGLDEGWGEWDG